MLLAIFFASFSIWAIAKCNRTQVQLSPHRVAVVQPDTTIVQSNTNGLPPIVKVDTINSTTAAKPKENHSPQKEIKKIIVDRSILYITIDGLRLRTGPSLDSTTIVKLPLFEKVYFLDEVTDFKQEINLGLKVTEEPWVKVKTKKGVSGWVYGAGVNYYKKKQDGVL